jgi:inner membrane protein
MDSITQIVLGAAVGELVAGRKIGYKAALWGALAGTIPDLDVVFALFVDPITYLGIHRGFTHSIFFAFIASPFLAIAAHRIHRRDYAKYRDWLFLFFWALFTHPLLDVFTGYGTQLLFPFTTNAFELNTIFIVDLFVTIPLAFCLIAALRLPREHPRRFKWMSIGIGITIVYLLITVSLKIVATQQFRSEMDRQDIAYERMMTVPGPFSSLLWRALAETDDGYYQGYYSLFDGRSQPIYFTFTPRNEHKIEDIKDSRAVEQLLWFSKGYYTIEESRKKLYFHDLRFGSIFGWKNDFETYIFTFTIEEDYYGEMTFRQIPLPVSISGTDFRELISRTFGRKQKLQLDQEEAPMLYIYPLDQAFEAEDTSSNDTE